MEPDRRRVCREILKVDVFVRVDEWLPQYQAVDISDSGVRIRGAAPLEVHSMHALRITGLDLGIFPLGRVVWCRPRLNASDADRFEVGLEFVEMSAEDRAGLRERVDALQQA